MTGANPSGVNAPDGNIPGVVPNGNPHTNPYDETPYPDLSYAHTHPDRLAMLGHILGLTPAPVDACRVLELGCAGGGNLLPMAANLPDSRFVGIDYSRQQIDIGRKRIDALGLQNLTLLDLDVTDETAAATLLQQHGLQNPGPFDYIIAHGLYSWVAQPVREAMFALCKQVLAPHGILYVSYNTLPGWNITRIVREAMLFHARASASPQETTDKAKEMVQFLAEHVPDQHEAYRSIFQRYHAMLNAGMKGANASFLLHDELEAVNEPIYFQDFVAHAAQHEFQYFVEAELANVLPHAFGADVMQKLQSMATTPIELEQYMDFLRNRMFRQSLLCHAKVEPTRMLRPEPIMQLYVRSESSPGQDAARGHASSTSSSGETATRPQTFQAPDNAALSTDHPLSQTALAILGEVWPRALHFDTLIEQAYARQASHTPSPTDPTRLAQDRLLVAANLLRGHGHSSRLVGLHSHAPRLSTGIEQTLRAAPVARFEARTRNAVTNLWHERVQLDEPKRQLLLLLDGSTARDELDALWRARLQASPRLGQAAEARHKLQRLRLEDELAWLARASLLVSAS